MTFAVNKTEYEPTPDQSDIDNKLTGPGAEPTFDSCAKLCPNMLNMVCLTKYGCWGRLTGALGALSAVPIVLAVLWVAFRRGWITALLKWLGRKPEPKRETSACGEAAEKAEGGAKKPPAAGKKTAAKGEEEKGGSGSSGGKRGQAKGSVAAGARTAQRRGGGSSDSEGTEEEEDTIAAVQPRGGSGERGKAEGREEPGVGGEGLGSCRRAALLLSMLLLSATPASPACMLPR